MAEVNKDKIYKEIARETGIHFSEVEKACKHQFQYVAKIMKQGKFEGVRLPYFGKFWVKPSRLKHLQRKGEIR